MDIWNKYKSPLGYYNNDNQIDSYGVNHSGFTTPDELAYQKARNERERNLMDYFKAHELKEFPQYGTNFWGRSADNNYGFGTSNITALSQNNANETPMEQIVGATKDMIRNYFDMKKDNTVGADDYFHCKANYEAAQRGKYGTLTAQILGDQKEVFDYFKNRYYKGLNFPDALADYWHDKDVNRQGRELVKSPLYSTSREACKYQRVNGINEKY